MGPRQISISTHNVNGFVNSREFIRSRCNDEPDTIQCIQEHWLRPPFKDIKGINEFRHIHEDFDGFATSAMKEQMEKKVLTGRPYGGTGFLWNRHFSNSIKPRTEFKHERVTVIEIANASKSILCINIYMPYLNTSKLEEQKTIYSDTLGFIEHVMDSNTGCDFIVLGDFNCNIFNSSHPFSPLLLDFVTRRNLFCTYNLHASFNPQHAFTRSNYGAENSGTLLDYIFISYDLRPSVSKVAISHFSNNVSDHLPVTIDIELDLTCFSPKVTNYSPMNIN